MDRIKTRVGANASTLVYLSKNFKISNLHKKWVSPNKDSPMVRVARIELTAS